VGGLILRPLKVVRTEDAPKLLCELLSYPECGGEAQDHQSRYEPRVRRRASWLNWELTKLKHLHQTLRDREPQRRGAEAAGVVLKLRPVWADNL
jgi:hypothetical protein